ncbi:hypothetical protein NCPPB940_38450 [Xanthomonas hortorum pv. taraxaci]|nr:hypothetical protein NCPPB940_38450 [Xanthomonas hortorum pv. taraxaci]CAD0353368.1 hypothetical protein NCPPB940_38450 [Xanthomonas hortorum pv. taraxaci]
MSAIPPPIHPSSSAAPGPVPNHLIWAIVSTVLGFCLCCPALISGIVAIVFSRAASTPIRNTSGCKVAQAT